MRVDNQKGQKWTREIGREPHFVGMAAVSHQFKCRRFRKKKKKGSQPRVGRREPGEHPIFILNLTSRAG